MSKPAPSSAGSAPGPTNRGTPTILSQSFVIRPLTVIGRGTKISQSLAQENANATEFGMRPHDAILARRADLQRGWMPRPRAGLATARVAAGMGLTLSGMLK